jgi:hypothetical protein
MDLAALEQVLALPEHDRSGPMEIGVFELRRGALRNSRGEVLGGYARG